MRLTSVRTNRDRLTRYWASAAIHLVAVAFDRRVLRIASKVALMPALVSWVRAQQGPPLLVTALLVSAAGVHHRGSRCGPRHQSTSVVAAKRRCGY
jgi:hypothetical protein